MSHRAMVVATLVAVLLLTASRIDPGAQTQSRIATTRALLLKNPLFFHTRTVAITDTPQLLDGVWRLPAAQNKHLIVAFRTAPGTDRAVEIRGTFIDIGRLSPDDSRIVGAGLREAVEAVLGAGAAWPARETFFAITNATTTAADEATQTPSVRALAMAPEKFDGKPVTMRGRFRGRNLLGDMPTWPKQTDFDFVLQAGDGATWVTGVKPKGKGFDLDPESRRDVGRWLEVIGTATVVDGLPMIRATAVNQSTPEEDLIEADTRPAPPPLPPPTLTFSVPTNDETGVAPDTLVRIQFSRDLKSETFEGRVKVAAVVNGAATDTPALTLNYRPGTLSLELNFDGPLPRFATITIRFLAGITAPDGTPFAPTTLTFYTGG
jgi:hypothetical protein